MDVIFELMLIFLPSLLLGLIPAFIAKSKGKNFLLWYIYGALIFIVALIHILVIPSEKDRECGQGYQFDSANSRMGQGGMMPQGQPMSYRAPVPVAAESVSQFDLNSPVDILNYEISSQSERTGVAVTFKNNLDRPVTALRLEARGTNSFGQQVLVDGQEHFELLAQDLKGAPGMVFRTVGYLWLPERDLRKLEIRVKQICLLDGSAVEIEEPHYVTVELTMVDNRDLMYLNQKMPRARYYPKQEETYWICSCGRPNKEEQETCLECKERKRDVFDIDRVIEQGKVDFKREEERRRHIEKQRQEEAAKRRKRTIIIAVSVAVFIVLGGTAYVVIQKTVMPDVNYNNAVTAFEDGDYEKAMKLFGSNRDYKDSEEMHTEATYQRGVEVFEAGNYNDARFLFGSISYYKDSAEYLEKAYEELYN